MENENEWTKICAACAEGTPPERCVYYGEPSGCSAPKLGQHPDGNVAERLQQELEKAERRIAELERAPGNVDAMRKALKSARRTLKLVCEHAGEFVQPRLAEEIIRSGVAVERALSAPARNCDRYDVEGGVAACMQAIDAAWHEIDTIRATISWMFSPAKGCAE